MIRIAPATAEDQVFAPQTPVTVTTHAWDEGEQAVAAVVVRRLSTTHLKVRMVEGGAFAAVHQQDLEVRAEAA